LEEERNRFEELAPIIGPKGMTEYQTLYDEVMGLITKLDQYIGNGGLFG
jgi:hypothetical protein